MSIYTCTMNLAIDLFIETEEMLNGKVNRTLSNDVLANGKGVNVSLILNKLGIENHALGFSGGFTGRYIAETLEKEGIKQSFIEVDGLTRINVFTKVNQTKEEFKLVNQGPYVTEEAQEKLLNQIRHFEKDDYLIVSGSLPKGVDRSIIVTIAKICSEKGVHLVLDVSDPIVMDCLPYQPYLLKPNEEELATWFHQKSLEESEMIFYARELINKGANQVLLSLGGEGVLFVDNLKNLYRCTAPSREVVNTACAGDTLLGTFLAKQWSGEEIVSSLTYSVAAGSSTAFRSGLTDFSDVAELEQEINIRMGE